MRFDMNLIDDFSSIPFRHPGFHFAALQTQFGGGTRFMTLELAEFHLQLGVLHLGNIGL
jgi:hypothetical protein